MPFLFLNRLLWFSSEVMTCPAELKAPTPRQAHAAPAQMTGEDRLGAHTLIPLWARSAEKPQKRCVPCTWAAGWTEGWGMLARPSLFRISSFNIFREGSQEVSKVKKRSLWLHDSSVTENTEDKRWYADNLPIRQPIGHRSSKRPQQGRKGT